MVKVRFYTTVAGRDRFVKSECFDTMEYAIAAVDEWESRTIENYAVYLSASE